MSAETYLASRGITLQQARDFIMANLANPGLIFEVADEYGVTVTMLAEIVGHAEADVLAYFTAQGYSPVSLDLPPGVTVPDARQFVMDNLDDPAHVFNVVRSYGLSTTSVAWLVGVRSSDVWSYFSLAGLNAGLLDAAAAARSQAVVLEAVPQPAGEAAAIDVVGIGAAASWPGV